MVRALPVGWRQRPSPSAEAPEPDLKTRPCSTSRASPSASPRSPLGLNNSLLPQALGEALGEKRRRKRRKSVRSVGRLSGYSSFLYLWQIKTFLIGLTFAWPVLGKPPRTKSAVFLNLQNLFCQFCIIIKGRRKKKREKRSGQADRFGGGGLSPPSSLTASICENFRTFYPSNMIH